MNIETPLMRQPEPADVATQYEAARRQLARALSEYVADLDTSALPAPAARELAHRRNEVIETGLTFFGPLRRFVHREVIHWGAIDGFELDDAPVDDIVATIYLAAVEHADEAPHARAFYTWLRRIGRREVRAALLEQERLNRIEVSLEEPVMVVGDWPDRVVRLISVLADPAAEIPDDLLIAAEDTDALSALLDKLPERWREVFLLRVVDGWESVAIAEAEGIAAEDVRAIVESSRTFLRDWLEENASIITAH
ncbi:MAG TPA: sigma-70 family RNA polymerase sigma factor [Thermomicrobiales bacterium]|jgi:RNA polymerase sigma factor (sigma-70 family)|nr:hypothetical protein [Chloroflexota bacterium]HBY46935.1 hypothetical protein [Chloroflexota bacterium]HCG30915.1 hypothetical protein [Chloroflexota bacterium]HQZ90809.1 sigma-70 family RNA polymerase sigma factor [Thermomicrobiales bacterium]HRA32360.1 sigma-70 family RNA polymerase sigma factor [Thermomicrobiales bacterium]